MCGEQRFVGVVQSCYSLSKEINTFIVAVDDWFNGEGREETAVIVGIHCQDI